MRGAKKTLKMFPQAFILFRGCSARGSDGTVKLSESFNRRSIVRRFSPLCLSRFNLLEELHLSYGFCPKLRHRIILLRG
ncbi:hypothetical protein CfE428DRAFT_1413 [Chthoniobacter flavus Ellin428]|uniref:Uncharacterized protein n=1 Tax=Chthoniobacter flavus Ellin428 TaxID=497964 RepID=B4CXX2_9BACT|nr:hypothetical protein CfE428DRAFT_1413 [Chthoniobacter flavus Ellin428]TCO83615.1 hypothetical protein EV701_14128 [Chthoniobacter flavus]